MSEYDESPAQSAAQSPVQRRTVLLAGGGAAAGVLLSGCIVQAPPESAAPPAATGQPAKPSQSGQPSQTKQTGEPVEPQQPALAKVDEVPAGGGVVLKDQKLVVTRDQAGKAAAFSAVCTHQGCIVATVANGTINCDCHGSKFDAATGEVVDGPARRPLDSVAVQQRDGAIFRA